MKYLNNAFKFLTKFYILAVPLLILNVLSALLNSKGSSNIFSEFSEMFGNQFSNFDNIERFSDPKFIFSLVPSILAFTVGASLLAILMKFIAEPATYGMINKAQQVGTADLNDFIPSLKENFVKYLLYWVGTIIVGIIIGIVFLVVILIVGLLIALLKWVGVIFLIIALIAMFIVGIMLSVFMSLWFTTMVVDDLDVIGGLKRSVGIAKKNFFVLLGVDILIAIGSFVVSGILGMLVGWIPVIGTIVLSVVPTASAFIMIAFRMDLYKQSSNI